MKKILYKLVELLPFFSVLAVLGFVGYWQMAQYNKIERLELQIQQYQQQLQLSINQKTSLKKGLQSVEQSTENLTTIIQQLLSSKRIIIDNNNSKEQINVSLTTQNTTTEPSKKSSEKPAPQKILSNTYNSNTDAVKQENFPVKLSEGIKSDSEVDKNKPEAITKQQLKKQLIQCSSHLNANRLTRGNGGNAYDCYIAILEKSPENKLALAGIKQIEKKYIQSIKKYISKNNLPKAQYFLDTLIRINPQNSSIAFFQEKLVANSAEQSQKDTAKIPDETTSNSGLGLEQQLKQCKTHLDNHRLTYGKEGNAFDCYSSILKKHPENKTASIGLLRIEKRYQRYIKKYIVNNNLPKAERFVATLTMINPNNKEIPLLKKQLNEAKGLPPTDKSKSLPETPTSTQKQPVANTSQPVEMPVNENEKLPQPIDTTELAEAIVTKQVTEKQTTSTDSFVQITAGCFNRNITIDSKDICIKNNYRISKYEVTQKQWQDIMKNNPSRFINCGGNCPVENVSWFDVQEFIRKLNNKTGKQYRLPTDDEWEYAARAGSNTEFSFGNNPDQLAQYGNYCDKNCANDWNDKNHDDGAITTTPIGSYKANAWGLFDFHGNIWEWVADKDSDKHIYRGGSWGDSSELCQSSSRGSAKPDFHVSGIGFRLVEN
jgi:Sulfatase-modifying factor enzyme 1